MARQIDLDQLMKYPLRRGSEHCDEKNAGPRFLNGVESILEWAQTLPTLTPPNEPLTPERLREMDGEPVWFDTIKRWGIVKVCRDGVFVLTKSGEFEVGRCKYYRRPPEGDADACGAKMEEGEENAAD